MRSFSSDGNGSSEKETSLFYVRARGSLFLNLTGKLSKNETRRWTLVVLVKEIRPYTAERQLNGMTRRGIVYSHIDIVCLLI